MWEAYQVQASTAVSTARPGWRGQQGGMTWRGAVAWISLYDSTNDVTTASSSAASASVRTDHDQGGSRAGSWPGRHAGLAWYRAIRRSTSPRAWSVNTAPSCGWGVVETHCADTTAVGAI